MRAGPHASRESCGQNTRFSVQARVCFCGFILVWDRRMSGGKRKSCELVSLNTRDPQLRRWECEAAFSYESFSLHHHLSRLVTVTLQNISPIISHTE